MKSNYGYSIHTGVDEDGFIHRQTVTPGNAHDSTERDTLLLGDEAALYADAAYYSQAKRDKMDRLGINDQAQRKGYRGHALSDANRLRNNSIAVTCPGGERSFTTYKSRYGLARTRLMGLAKNLTLLGMTAIAHYIAKGSTFLTLYGIPSQNPLDSSIQNQEIRPKFSKITASGRHKL